MFESRRGHFLKKSAGKKGAGGSQNYKSGSKKKQQLVVKKEIQNLEFKIQNYLDDQLRKILTLQRTQSDCPS